MLITSAIIFLVAYGAAYVLFGAAITLADALARAPARPKTRVGR